MRRDTDFDAQTTSDCCDAAIEYAGGAHCGDCGRGVRTDDLRDQAEMRAPGDPRRLEQAATSPVRWTATDWSYRSAVHALESYLQCRAASGSGLDPSPMPSGGVSPDAAYARDVHEARELERIFREAHEQIHEHLDAADELWRTWCAVRVEGRALRDVDDVPQSTVNSHLNTIDGWIEWTLDEWGKYEGNADRPVGLGGRARQPEPETKSLHGDHVVHATAPSEDQDRPEPTGVTDE